MNLQSPSVVFLLWCPQPVLQSVVALILWRRGLNKTFPTFFWFLLVQVASFAIVFPFWLMGNYSLYFGFYWLSEAANAVLGFKMIHEVFIDIFRPYHTLRDLGTLLFKWAGLVMLMVSVVVAFSNSFNQSPLVHAITTLKGSVLIAQVGLILFLLLFSSFLGVSRKQVSFGISLGLGLFAAVELLIYALRTGGLVVPRLFDLIDMVVCNLSILIWLGYSLSTQTVRRTATNHFQTARWERGLADLQPPVPSDSLIPMFEGIVERAFSRTSNLDGSDTPLPPDRPLTPPKASSAAAGAKDRP